MFGQNNYPIGIRIKRGLLSGLGSLEGVAPDPYLITSLYQNILGRQPDPGGLTFWMNAYAESGDINWLQAAFTAAAIVNGETIVSTPATPSQVAQVVATSEIVTYNPNTGQTTSTVTPTQAAQITAQLKPGETTAQLTTIQLEEAAKLATLRAEIESLRIETEKATTAWLAVKEATAQTPYYDPSTGRTISTAQAIEEGLIEEPMGEIQIAGIPTWGMIALGGVALFLLFGSKNKKK